MIDVNVSAMDKVNIVVSDQDDHRIDEHVAYAVSRTRMKPVFNLFDLSCQARSDSQAGANDEPRIKLLFCTWQSGIRSAQFCPVWAGAS